MDLPDLSHILILLFFAGFVVVFGLAIRFGGAPERLGAAILAIMPALQFALYSAGLSDLYEEVDLVSLLVDGFALAGFTYIVARADRDYWTRGAFALALIATLAHFAREYTDMLGFSYAQFKSFPTAGIIALVAVGTFTHQQRIRRDGFDRDWVPSEYSYFRSLPEKLDDL